LIRTSINKLDQVMKKDVEMKVENLSVITPGLQDSSVMLF